MKIRLLICVLLLSFSIRGYGQNCTLAVSVSESEPTICSGNSISLKATVLNGKAPFTYVWNTGQTSATIEVNKADTYTVTVTDKTPGCQPVKQSITVTATATPDAPTAQNQVVCPNGTAMLMATAPGGNYQWYDANGNFLVSGASYTTPPVTAQTTYYVQTTLNGCTSNRAAVEVSITGKPTVTGATICAGSMATLLATGGDNYAWYATSSATGTPLNTNANYTTPVLNATKTYYVVVTSGSCSSSPTAVTATVTPDPQPPSVTNEAICAGTNVTLQASVPSGIVSWYNAPTGGVPLISSPDYTTPVLNANTTYYVENDVNDCVSRRVPVTVTVTAPPQAPATQTYSVCYQSSAVLTAGNSALTYNWYSAATGGNPFYTGKTYTTPVLTTSTTYYVQLVNGSCESDRTAITVNVKPMLSAPSVAEAIICPGSMATLTATSENGGTYQWFNVPNGGTPIATTNTFTTPALNINTTYYVQSTVSGCISPRAAVTVSVLTAPAPPTVTYTTVCSGSPAVISASSPTGSYGWYSAATGGTLLSSAQVYVTPDLTATTIYYVEALNTNGCASTRTPLRVTVDAIPPAPNAPDVSTCSGTAAELTASAPSGSFQWYATATGGTMLASGANYITPVLFANNTYYVQNIVSGCVSPRTTVTVTINTVIDPQFQYASGTQCSSGPNVTPTLFNTNGGTFSATPAGLVFVSTITGEINTAASTPGAYTISYAGNGPCAHTSTSTFAIESTPNANFSYNGPFCQDGVDPLPVFPTGGSAGNFTATPAGLIFVDATTGEIDLSQCGAGTYNITNTINPGGGCPSATAQAQVVIQARAVVSAGPSQTVATGTPVQLAGSITGGVTTGAWSGGTGSFSNPNLPNAVYMPGAGETQANLKLTSDDPPGLCGPGTAMVTIYFVTPPAAPTIQGTTICDGTNTTLAPTAPGGTYEWFTTATGTSPLYTGQTFTTLWLSEPTTYYVQTTIDGFTSTRSAVTINVDPVPVAPIVAPVQTCSGNTAMLTATGSTGSYEWYDAAEGGNLVYIGPTYVTPVLQTNTSYYVQAHSNNCSSPRTEVDITVGGSPAITSASSDNICSGTALNYNITSDQALGATTYSWSRNAVTGISNPAVSGQTSSTINETLINTSSNPVNVTYVIIASNGSCFAPAFNYVVTVNPVPTVTSSTGSAICNENTDDYQIVFSTPPSSISWGRAAVTGISNAAVSGQNSSSIQEVLFNTTTAPIIVPYLINSQLGTCSSTPFTLNITVNPTASVTSDSTGVICSGTAQNYTMASDIASATYIWSRDAVNNISNAPVSNQTSATIDETLVNTGISPVNVKYIITPQAYGCPGTPFKYTVTVNPVGEKPVANSNSPICIGSTIELRTTPQANSTYLWTGPNSFSSTLQNPNILSATAAMAGTYTLVVTNKQGCPAPENNVTVAVDAPGISIAGANQTVCSTAISVALNGQITGGPATGIWSTGGTGTFSSATALNTQYIPSEADVAAGSVVLTLSSASPDNCAISTSSVTITFGPIPGVDAGLHQEVCAEETAVKLAGQILVPGLTIQWTSSGTGTFIPSDNQPDASYVPSAADQQSGKVILTLKIVNGGPCYITSDTTSITFVPPPKVDPGGTVLVLKGKQVTLNPVVSGTNLTYLWTPDIDISNVNIKNPVITGDIDRSYTLAVTDSRGCQATSVFNVKVSPPIIIPNTFTPNGDGVNDKWEISGLIAYTQATVDIFNRYGQKLFHSIGYPIPWDGTYNNKPVPSGEYYYIINTNYNNQVLSGNINLIR